MPRRTRVPPLVSLARPIWPARAAQLARLAIAWPSGVAGACALILAVGCAGPEAPAPAATDEAADLVLLGGTIVTLEEGAPEVEALAAKDGRIVALGSRAEIESQIGDATEVIELAPGELAIPGFIEGHAHFMGIGDSAIQLDLRGADSWQTIVDQVAAAVAETPPGQWIRGRGWHQDKWQTQRPSPSSRALPIHDSLSAVSPDQPGVPDPCQRPRGLFANAKAMELAGIDASAPPDPPGGEILRDAAGWRADRICFRETAAAPDPAQARSRDGGTPPPEEIARDGLSWPSEEVLWRKASPASRTPARRFEEIDAPGRGLGCRRCPEGLRLVDDGP